MKGLSRWSVASNRWGVGRLEGRKSGRQEKRKGKRHGLGNLDRSQKFCLLKTIKICYNKIVVR